MFDFVDKIFTRTKTQYASSNNGYGCRKEVLREFTFQQSWSYKYYEIGLTNKAYYHKTKSTRQSY